MLETQLISVEEIYVPAKLRKTLDEDKVATLAESILEKGLEVPIQVRRDDARNRFVLVAGLHRLEAVRALGEETVGALVVSARKF